MADAPGKGRVRKRRRTENGPASIYAAFQTKRRSPTGDTSSDDSDDSDSGGGRGKELAKRKVAADKKFLIGAESASEDGDGSSDGKSTRRNKKAHETSLLDTPSQQDRYGSSDSDSSSADGGGNSSDGVAEDGGYHAGRQRSPPAHTLNTRGSRNHAGFSGGGGGAAAAAASSRSRRASLSRSRSNSPAPGKAGRSRGGKAGSAVAKARARLAAIKKDAATVDSDSESDSDVEATAEPADKVTQPQFPYNKDLPEKFKCYVYNPVDDDWTKMMVKPTTELSKVYEAVATKWPTPISVDELKLTYQGRHLNAAMQFATAGFKDAADAKKIEVRKQQDLASDDSDDADDTADANADTSAGGYRLILRHKTHAEQKMSVGATTTFEMIFSAYAARVGAASASAFKFTFEGDALAADDKPEDADMDTHDGTADGDVNLVDVHDQ